MKTKLIMLFTVLAMASLCVMPTVAASPPNHEVGIVGVNVDRLVVPHRLRVAWAPDIYGNPFAIMDYGDLSPFNHPRTVSMNMPNYFASPVDALDTGQFQSKPAGANYATYYESMDSAWRAFAVDDFATADDPAAAESG